MISPRPLLAAIALFTVILLPAPGQFVPCPVTTDDGFNIGCCTPVTTTTIPSFPALGTRANYGCIRDCNLEAQFDTRVRLTHIPAFCDISQILIDVLPASPGAPRISGFLLAKYSRTFLQTDPTGVTRQVWRFLVNGDLQFDTTLGGPAPCPTPTSWTLGMDVHFFGTVDYYCDFNSTVGYGARLDLSHLPKCISHASWSERPLPAALIPGNRSYHLVGGPTPFTFAGTPAPAGSMIGEAVRSSTVTWSPFSYACLGEQQTVQGQIQTLGNTCICTSPAPSGPFRYTEQNFFGTNVCGGAVTSYSSFGITGISGAGGILSLGLGSYANGDRLTVYWGLMNYTDLCTSEGPWHIACGSGVSYAGGFTSFHTAATPVPTRSAIDLANSLPLSSASPTLGWGLLHASTQVFQINL